MLVVPQPINASKVSPTGGWGVYDQVFTSAIQMGAMGGDGGVGFSHHHINGGGRKYQCKMCPQVGTLCSLSVFIYRDERDILSGLSLGSP